MPKKCTNEQAAFYAKELFLNYASIMDVEMQKREFVSMKSIFMKCAQSMINRINLSISPSDLTDSLIIAHREAPLYDDVVETFEYLKDKYQIIIARACLKIAFWQMCVTICGRFVPNEGRIAGYVT